MAAPNLSWVKKKLAADRTFADGDGYATTKATAGASTMCHVLIIEDEMLVALHLELMLADYGATSFAFADSEADALEQARIRAPDIITSDVRLRCGTGPKAVQAILGELGPRPVIFITGTPDECEPCNPPHRVFSKPIHEPTIAAAFREMAPA